jgi:hypothetical protein
VDKIKHLGDLQIEINPNPPIFPVHFSKISKPAHNRLNKISFFFRLKLLLCPKGGQTACLLRFQYRGGE